MRGVVTKKHHLSLAGRKPSFSRAISCVNEYHARLTLGSVRYSLHKPRLVWKNVSEHINIKLLGVVLYKYCAFTLLGKHISDYWPIKHPLGLVSIFDQWDNEDTITIPIRFTISWLWCDRGMHYSQKYFSILSHLHVRLTVCTTSSMALIVVTSKHFTIVSVTDIW